MKIIACNLKMNLMPSELPNYIEGMKEIKDDVIILPPYIYISDFIKEGFTTGSQDIGFKEIGAYTGDVSILQLKELGIKYSIIGHSERRCYHLDDLLVNNKIKLCLEHDVMPILCVGETQEENDRNETLKVCTKELDGALLNNELKKIIIAYEPIWSIGTGVVPSNDFIDEPPFEEIRITPNNFVKIINGEYKNYYGQVKDFPITVSPSSIFLKYSGSSASNSIYSPLEGCTNPSIPACRHWP